ncbi:hypothetical protein RND71_042629 [Anisodus tanguticus]|uniref:Uncharacterized protein n=1 Tax=Anisodus tanguticus TaxID=243964 RepID=A0AAE1QTT0_9SOLA|nr:hypothetical protein RND71_042629 [Anisodus tanguticus]
MSEIDVWRFWIGDGGTGSAMVSEDKTRDHYAKIPSTQMIGSFIFSPSTDIHTDTMIDEINNKSLSRKRYVFFDSKLKLLKAQVTSETGVENPTRLEVLSALIYK